MNVRGEAVEFVFDFTDKLLDDVFERNHTHNGIVGRDDDNDVGLFLYHHFEQFWQRHILSDSGHGAGDAFDGGV